MAPVWAPMKLYQPHVGRQQYHNININPSRVIFRCCLYIIPFYSYTTYPFYSDCMTSAYAALKPFPLPPTSPITLELATLNTEPEQPYAAFVHHLYVRPLTLNFESQKIFARARNIACSIELKDSDSGDNKPLQVIVLF